MLMLLILNMSFWTNIYRLIIIIFYKNTKIYDKRDIIYDIVNFLFLDGDVPRRPSYGIYISQLIRFARASSHVTDFNNRNKFLAAKPSLQCYSVLCTIAQLLRKKTKLKILVS